MRVFSGDVFARGNGAILSYNNGHRSCPAWACPSSEVPLVCSAEEWERIRAADFARVYRPSSWRFDGSADDVSALLRPRRRDSSYNTGYVRETSAGRWRERRLSSMVSGGCYIRVLERFPDFETGEELRPYVRVSDCDWDGENLSFAPEDVRFMVRHSSRADNIRSVRASCERFKWLVRANEHSVRLFVTLTYAENMRDTRRLYNDTRNFLQKLRRRYPSITGYLAAYEPQRRGAWHAHILVLAPTALYIPNRRMNALWGHGFTKVQACRSVRDVGVYLTSYLTNIKDGSGTKKGARLALYPLGFRFTRWSRSVERPQNTTFWGRFGDFFRDVDSFELCFDFQNKRRLETGETLLSRVALFCREKPK